MQVRLLKDWADHKKSALIEIKDENVLKAGFEAGLFEKAKESKPKK